MMSAWKKLPTRIVLVFVVILAVAHPSPAVEWSVGPLRVQATSHDAATASIRHASWIGNADLFVLDGKTAELSTRSKTARSLAVRDRHLSWRVTLSNPTEVPLRLTVGVRVSGRFGTPLTFWDGLGESAVAEAESDREANNNIRGSFPMSCLVSGQVGIAVGLAPLEIVSWFEHSYAPAADGAQLACAVRLAIAPGETVTKEFVLYGFQAPFGYRDALQVYYDEFPAVFRPLPDVDQRVNLNGATYHAWTVKDPEMCRRMRAGWEWCYAPFRRTGDWYGRADRWDYQPARAMSKDRNVPREAYLAARRERFKRGDRCNVAMCFYLPSCIWVETQLVKQDYADATIYRQGKPYELLTPWVTGHDNETMVYPWGNKLADDSMADMRKIVDELDVAGFAFDTADGGWPYRGPAIANSPGRAWDDEGEFCDVSVAIAGLMDFVHTLRKDGKRVAMVSNPGESTTFMLPFRSDSAMLEKPPYLSVETHLLPLRHLLGHKTMVWWDDWSAARVLRWKDMEGKEIHQALLGMRDYTLLASIYYGGIPTPRLAAGTPKLMRALPMIVELVQAGWQPTPGATTDPTSSLWISRFGLGEKTFIAVCNQTANEFAGDLIVRHDYLKAGSPRFLTYDGRPVTQKSSGGTTRLPIRLASRDYAVFRLSPPAPKPDPSLFQFPFEKAVIALPEKPSPADEYAAFRVQEYFRYYYAKAAQPPQKVEMPIVKQAVMAAGPQIVISADGPKLEGSNLLVPADRERLMNFLNALDEKFFYVGRFSTSGEVEGEGELLQKAGVAGKILD